MLQVRGILLLIFPCVVLVASFGCTRGNYENPMDPMGAGGLLFSLDVSSSAVPPTLVVQGLPDSISEGQSARILVGVNGEFDTNISVSIASSDSAITLSNPSLQFSRADAVKSRSITLTAASDSDVNDEIVRLSFSAPGLSGREHFITNVDVDTYGFVFSGVKTITEGGNGIVTVRLAGEPPGPVGVNISSDDTSRLTVSPAVLNFTPANFSSPQNITIAGVEDADWMQNVVFLTAGHASLGQTKAGITITDNDTAFAASVVTNTSDSIDSMAMGDLDGDGKADVVINTNNNIALYRSTSVGAAISFNLDNTYSSTGFPRDITLADFDGDGKLDIVALSRFGNSVEFFRNTSSVGGISMAAGLSSPLVSSGASEIIAGDFDGDGKTDVAFTLSTPGQWAYMENTGVGVGTISFAVPTFVSTSNAAELYAADLDGDARTDIIVTTSAGGQVHIQRNTSSGDGNFNWSPHSISSVFGTGVAAADLDGDGKNEILVANPPEFITILRNTSTIGSPSFVTTNTDFTQTGVFVTTIGFSSAVDQVAVTDLDGDGKPDLVLGNGGGGAISAIRNSSSPGIVRFDVQSDFSFPSNGLNSPEVVIGDVNGDGRPDVGIVVNIGLFGNDAFAVFRNTLP